MFKFFRKFLDVTTMSSTVTITINDKTTHHDMLACKDPAHCATCIKTKKVMKGVANVMDGVDKVMWTALGKC